MPKGHYKRYALVGPGGLKCKCCCDPGYRPTLKRQAKRREHRAFMEEFEAFLRLSAALPSVGELTPWTP